MRIKQTKNKKLKNSKIMSSNSTSSPHAPNLSHLVNDGQIKWVFIGGNTSFHFISFCCVVFCLILCFCRQRWCWKDDDFLFVGDSVCSTTFAARSEGAVDLHRSCSQFGRRVSAENPRWTDADHWRREPLRDGSFSFVRSFYVWLFSIRFLKKWHRLLYLCVWTKKK